MSDWSGVPEAPSPGPGDPVPGSDLSALRRSYSREPLVESELPTDPFDQFRRWFEEVAQLTDVIPEPNAMVLATADDQGHPSARTVLLKGLDERGFVLFTNYTSRKGTEALSNPHASLVFPWFAVERQVVVVGSIHPIDPGETEAYFRSRPRGSQLGAWASRQSSVVADRAVLDASLADVTRRFEGQDVPVPDFWGGLRVEPSTVEFWHGRPDRMHDRLRYRRSGHTWLLERLSP